MRKKKLVIATDNFLPRWDGISRFLSEIVPRLAKKYNITIIAPDYGKTNSKDFKIVKIPVKYMTYGDFNPAKIEYTKIKKEPLLKKVKEEKNMAAAALTPTVVQKTYKVATSVTGTPIRLVEYFVQITKVTQLDWIVAATYCPGTYLGASGFTIDGSADGAAETVTYATSGDTIVLGSANVGTAYLIVTCVE